MGLLDALVEQRIAEAIASGAFEDLPGAGRPLDLEDDRLVPEDLRVGYRILRNAGFVPPEIEERREAANLHALLRAATADEETQRRVRAKLALLEAALEARGGSLRANGYFAHVVDRLAGS